MNSECTAHYFNTSSRYWIWWAGNNNQVWKNFFQILLNWLCYMRCRVDHFMGRFFSYSLATWKYFLLLYCRFHFFYLLLSLNLIYLNLLRCWLNNLLLNRFSRCLFSSFICNEFNVTLKINSAIRFLFFFVLFDCKRKELCLIIKKRWTMTLEIPWRFSLAHERKCCTEYIKVKSLLVRQILLN